MTRDELPHLQPRGDFGTGKTRTLLVVGSICYKEPKLRRRIVDLVEKITALGECVNLIWRS